MLEMFVKSKCMFVNANFLKNFAFTTLSKNSQQLLCSTRVQVLFHLFKTSNEAVVTFIKIVVVKIDAFYIFTEHKSSLKPMVGFLMKKVH